MKKKINDNEKIKEKIRNEIYKIDLYKISVFYLNKL
jgi:hypothetical protein